MSSRVKEEEEEEEKEEEDWTVLQCRTHELANECLIFRGILTEEARSILHTWIQTPSHPSSD